MRLINEGQAGVKLADALDYARVNLTWWKSRLRPIPVCRVMDFSKYRYEQGQQQARKHQSTIVIKEIVAAEIGDADYETKKGHVVRFLGA